MKALLKCVSCAVYTLGERCPKCGGRTRVAAPARYSPADKWAGYRRAQKFGAGNANA